MQTHYKKPSFSQKDPIDFLVSPFQRFFDHEASSGVILVGCMVLAMFMANSWFAPYYFAALQTVLALHLGEAVLLSKPLLLWINDGMMAVFFLLVGLEIKREILVGELSDIKVAILPLAAALGGMVVPAGIYLALTWGSPEVLGWGIPMATDIAFALGVLAMMGRNIPLGLKVFLAAVAIVDDIGAVIVIAFFYTSQLTMAYLWGAAVLLLFLVALNLLGIRSPLPYALLGLVLWYFLLKSGIHATLAGVLLAGTIPARVKSSPKEFLALAHKALERFRSAIGASEPSSCVLKNPSQHAVLMQLKHLSRAAETPLQRIELRLLAKVTFFIVPMFVLANAGITIESGIMDNLSEPAFLGVLFGLALGKPLGITLASWLVIRFGISRLPDQVTMRHLLGAGCLAGIGFTMALFVGSLAFGQSSVMAQVKIGILAASLSSWLIGWLILAGCKKEQG